MIIKTEEILYTSTMQELKRSIAALYFEKEADESRQREIMTLIDSFKRAQETLATPLFSRKVRQLEEEETELMMDIKASTDAIDVLTNEFLELAVLAHDNINCFNKKPAFFNNPLFWK
jgi:hypothetical protein